MERINLNAETRDKVGKGVARALRRANIIPAVIYRGGESLPIKLNRKELAHFIKTSSGTQAVVNLKFPDGTSKLALLKEYLVDPVKGDLLHSDFFEVSLSEKVKVTVHISITGEPVGVKRDGGILQYGLREMELECLPDKIPDNIEVNVSELLTGHSIHVSDISLPEGIKVLTDPDELIAIVTAPIVEEVAAPVEAAPAEAEEPEVTTEGKGREGKGREGKEEEKEKEEKKEKKEKKEKT